MKDRPLAVRISVRMLLRKLWKRRGEFLPESISFIEFVKAAPELIVREVLGASLEYQSINNGANSAQIAGFLDRDKRQIVVATEFNRESQRFTLAHEIGHWMLHPGHKYFRERSIGGTHLQDQQRSPIEMEADQFAAELLMPAGLLTQIFESNFGSLIDGSEVNDDLCLSLSIGRSRKFSIDDLLSMTPYQRASLIARTRFYGRMVFQPLAEQFDVSSSAMAIRLLEIGLVR